MAVHLDNRYTFKDEEISHILCVATPLPDAFVGNRMGK